MSRPQVLSLSDDDVGMSDLTKRRVTSRLTHFKRLRNRSIGPVDEKEIMRFEQT